MAEQKKGGEAQSLQTPSISYDNSNSKGNGNLSNSQDSKPLFYSFDNVPTYTTSKKKGVSR